jgi:DNA-binding HxlR family transcriptional regulator
MHRSYRQFCGLARALDVVGDRWNLLIVRQLLTGPARYGELHDGLPGMATNLLADRLRDLEEAGVVERQSMAGGVPRYSLTAWGSELRVAVEALVRWSTPLMARGPAGDRFRVEWLMVALPALLSGTRRAGTIGIDIDGYVIQVRRARRGVEVGPHDGRKLDAVLRADPWVVLGIASGALALDDAVVRIEGDHDAIRAIFERRSIAAR